MIEGAHWGLALVPVLVMLGPVRLAGRLQADEPEGDRRSAFSSAGLPRWQPGRSAGRLLDTLPIGYSNYSRYIAPWIEEALKGLVMIGLFRFNRIGYKLDAVISGFAIGAGFSVVENIFYLTVFPFYGAGTWLVRGLGTAVMHGTTLAILAAVAHELAERENRESAGEFNFRLWWFFPGYLIAVAIHTTFNHFPDRPLLAMLGAAIFAPVALIGIFHIGSAEAERWLVTDRAEHRAQLTVLRAGRWPDSPRGAKDCGARRPPRPRSGHAHPPLLGAPGVARRRGRRDDD